MHVENNIVKLGNDFRNFGRNIGQEGEGPTKRNISFYPVLCVSCSTVEYTHQGWIFNGIQKQILSLAHFYASARSI